MGSALRRRLQLLVSGAHEAACGARRYMVARSSLVLSVADEAGEPSEDGREATRPLSLQQSHELLVGAPAVQSPNEGPVAVCCCCAPMLDKQHSSVLLLCSHAGLAAQQCAVAVLRCVAHACQNRLRSRLQRCR